MGVIVTIPVKSFELDSYLPNSTSNTEDSSLNLNPLRKNPYMQWMTEMNVVENSENLLILVFIPSYFKRKISVCENGVVE